MTTTRNPTSATSPACLPARTSRDVARERESQVLLAIALCGYLTTRLIAMWVWDASTEHVARNKAQLVLKRLEMRRLVIRRHAQSGEIVWILSRAGAQLLNEERTANGLTAWAKAGHDLGFTAIERDKRAIGRALALRSASPHASGVVGRAGLRAGVVHGAEDCDAVLLESDASEKVAITAIVAAMDAREALINRVVSMRLRGLRVELAGEPKTIAMLHRRVAAEMRARA